jgi:predicted metal-dependent hydrolase
LPEFEIPYTLMKLNATAVAHFILKRLHGLRLFNAGEYFEAHEALENAWRDEPGPIRDLYRGILTGRRGLLPYSTRQLSGARKMFQRCHQWLAPFPGTLPVALISNACVKII